MPRALRRLSSVLLLAAACLPVTAQVRIFTPIPPEPGYEGAAWTARPPLILGATVYRPSENPVRVWYRGEEATWRGSLYLVDPATRREIFLFDNTTASTDKLDISRHIPVGATVYFKYVLTGTPGSSPGVNPESWLPKYTGFDGPESPFYNQASSDLNVDPAKRYGNVWSVSGMVNDSTMEIGLEDNAGPLSDMDFDDVVFLVDNLKVQTPKRVPRRSFLW